MKKRNKIITIISIIFLALACDDILEEDITNDTITIISPKEGAIIISNTVQFNWQDLEGVDDYRIQVIKEDQVYEVDSLVTTATFTYPLSAGTYRWRIRGENFAYQTAYTFPIAFTVESSTDITSLNVVLQTPSDNFYTNTNTIVFTWDAIDIADSYTLELIKKLSGDQTVLQETGISTTSLSVDATILDEDAEYSWRVKAINETGETVFTERTLFLDTVIPNQPTATEPTDNDTVAISNITFNWTNGADTGNVKSAITNSLEIATDVSFNTIIHTASTQNNSLQYNFTTANTYYWRVKATDEAGNTSDYSAVRTLIVE